MVSTLLLVACGSAPKVNYCIPGSPDYGCSKGALPKEKAVNLICTDTRDQKSILRACKLGIGIPDSIEICIVNPGGESVACSDGNVKPAFGGDTTFVCLSESDLDRLFTWCKRKKK